MIADTHENRAGLDEQIEIKRLELMRNRASADIHANEFKRSVRSTLESAPVKIGAGIAGLLVARSLWRKVKESKRDRRSSDRRRSRQPGLLTFKNVITVATTSLAVLEKLKRKDAEVEKKEAQMEKNVTEVKYQECRDTGPESHPYH